MNKKKNNEEVPYILKEQRRGKYIFHRCQSAKLFQNYVNQINKIKQELKQSPKLFSNKFRNEIIQQELNKIRTTSDDTLKKNKFKIKSLHNTSCDFEMKTSKNNFSEKNKKIKISRPSTAISSLLKRNRLFKDKFKPNGYNKYNDIYTSSEIFKNNLKNYEISNENKVHNLSSYNIEKIMNDEKTLFENFFIKNKNNKELNEQLKLLHSKSQSDIFFLKEPKDNLIIPNKKPLNYNVLYESISKISDDNIQPGLINHNSIKYLIYNPSKKSFTKTLEEISNKSLFKNPAQKQGLISKFLNKRNFDNKQYNYFYNYDSRIFHKTKELCSKYVDIIKTNKGLTGWPFKKGN